MTLDEALRVAISELWQEIGERDRSDEPHGTLREAIEVFERLRADLEER